VVKLLVDYGYLRCERRRRYLVGVEARVQGTKLTPTSFSKTPQHRSQNSQNSTESRRSSLNVNSTRPSIGDGRSSSNQPEDLTLPKNRHPTHAPINAMPLVYGRHPGIDHDPRQR